MEPLRSANSTVTCLRSPSRALREVRIFSARWVGVYASGAMKRDGVVGGASTGCPHSRQNFAPAGSAVPHWAHSNTRRTPHSRQNFAWGGFCCWHCGHCISRLLSWRTLGTCAVIPVGSIYVLALVVKMSLVAHGPQLLTWTKTSLPSIMLLSWVGWGYNAE